MQYMLLIHVDELAMEARPEAEIKRAMAAHTPYIDMLLKNRKYASSAALGPTRSARTLRTSAGKPVVTEGPFAESREQFGGFYVIEADDLDDAIALASACPALETHGLAIEIRPIPAHFAHGSAGAPALPEGDPRSPYMLTFYRDEEAGDEAGDTLPLAPSGSATTLRRRDGKIVLRDGPFVKGPIQIGGYRIIGARDIEEAMRLASACPEASAHAIEVRPVRA